MEMHLTAEEKLADHVAQALAQLRDSETDMIARRKDATGRSAIELLALDLVQAARKPLTPKELSAALRVSSATITILVDRLVYAGLVERRPHASDRRSITLHPTQDIRQPWNPAQEVASELIDGMSTEDVRVVIHFLERTAAALDKRYP